MSINIQKYIVGLDISKNYGYYVFTFGLSPENPGYGRDGTKLCFD